MDQRVNDPLNEERTSTRRKVEELVAGVKEQAAKLKSRSLEDVWGDTVGYVKENPGKTILISMALGVLIGSYLRRRGD